MLVGKDRGKTGLIDHVYRQENRITVKGLNRYKKSVKPSKKAPKGGIIEINAKVPASNVAIICPSCSKISRIGYEKNKSRKMRICKKCGKSIEQIKS